MAPDTTGATLPVAGWLRKFDNVLGRLYEPGEVADFEGVLDAVHLGLGLPHEMGQIYHSPRLDPGCGIPVLRASLRTDHRVQAAIATRLTHTPLV